MSKTLTANIDLEKIENEIDTIKKKIFLYETMQSRKEFKEGKVKGPFKTAKEFLRKIKH